jgi:hypothetical protein
VTASYIFKAYIVSQKHPNFPLGIYPLPSQFSRNMRYPKTLSSAVFITLILATLCSGSAVMMHSSASRWWLKLLSVIFASFSFGLLTAVTYMSRRPVGRATVLDFISTEEKKVMHDPPGLCCICISDIEGEHRKMKCCANCMHADCLGEYIDHGRYCPLCRRNMVEL